MQQEIMSQHRVDEKGRPAGGTTTIIIARDRQDIGQEPIKVHHLEWQNGPLQVDGVRREPNGLFVESLIDAVIDRIGFYQTSGFACGENARAIEHLRQAQAALQSRTARRVAGGIEGTHGTDASERACPPPQEAAAS